MWVRYNFKLGKPVILCMSNPEIFTSEEWDENEDRKRELIELVASGEAVLMVGAGSSARVGYVTWDGLLEKLENLANRCDKGLDQSRKGDPLAYAEDIKSHICNKMGDLDKYHALLQKLFSPRDPPFTDFHTKLVVLPFRGILTTNYDTVLEAALGNLEQRTAYDNSLVIDENSAGRVREFLTAMNNGKRITRRIAHLHGKFDMPRTIILSIKDYEDAYGLDPINEEDQKKNEWKLRSRLLWAVLATRRVVFVGFSMDDPYLKKILKTVNDDLWGGDESIHFVIRGISDKNIKDAEDNADEFKSKYGVDTVFYQVLEDEVPEKKHELLESFFADIVKRCESRKRPIDETQDLPSDTDRSEGEESEAVSSESGSILNSLKQEIRRIIWRISDED